MNPTDYSLVNNQAIAISGTERWDIYHRLKELEIPCQCSTHQPLTVQLNSPSHLLQTWSVIRRMRTARQDLVNTLENYWQIKFED